MSGNPIEQMSADGKSRCRPMTGRGQKITVGAASAVSAALPADCTSVRLQAITAACWVHIDPAGNTTAALATGVDMYIGANQVPEYFVVAPGSYISVIQATGAAELEIMPCY
jgi:hypothetical protein